MIKLTKREREKRERAIKKMQLELDLACIDHRSEALMNAMVSDPMIKEVLLDAQYSNAVIQKALSRMIVDAKLPNAFRKYCDDVKNSEAAKKAAKSTKTKSSGKAPDDIVDGRNSSQNGCGRSQGTAGAPQV